jgi:hypothetical protein
MMSESGKRFKTLTLLAQGVDGVFTHCARVHVRAGVVVLRGQGNK